MSINPRLPRTTAVKQRLERLDSAIKIAIGDGYQGIDVHGRTSDGKSMAAEYLQAQQWRDEPAFTAGLTKPRRSNPSNVTLYKDIQSELGMTQHHDYSAANAGDAFVADRQTRTPPVGGSVSIPDVEEPK